MSADIVLSWAAETGLAVSLLVLLVLVIRKPAARHLGAGAAYALWALPVIRLFLPAITLPALPEMISPNKPAMAGNVFAFEASSAVAGSDPINWAPWILGTWLIGALVWLGWQFTRQRNFERDILSRSQAVDAATLKLASNIQARIGLRQTPRIVLSNDQDGPLVTGLLRPLIVLPRDFDTVYNTDQKAYAMAHELAHIKRRDLWAAAGALMFRALNWPNPLIHLAAPAFRADQEAACDASVLARLGNSAKARSGYAETLIHAAKMAGNPVRSMPLGLTIHNPLKERIMILKETPQKRLGLRMALAGVATAGLLASAPYTRAEGPDTPTPPDAPEVVMDGKSVEKKVMKWVTKDDNGNETKRHIEILTEDGVTTAYEIDPYGNKTQIDPDSIDMPAHEGHGQKRIKIMKMGDGDTELDIEQILEKHGVEGGDHKIIVKRMGEDGEFDILTEDMIGQHGGEDGQNVFVFKHGETVDVTSHGDGERQVIVKRMHGPGDGSAHGFAFSNGEGPGADMWVNIASEMMGKVETDDLDRKTRKKVEAARKALAEAKEALAEAQKDLQDAKEAR